MTLQITEYLGLPFLFFFGKTQHKNCSIKQKRHKYYTLKHGDSVEATFSDEMVAFVG